jgi:hypothetical protein
MVPVISEHRIATARFSGGPVLSGDPYRTGFSRSAASIKSWLPPIGVPMVDPSTGKCNESWYRFLNYLANQRLGGINGPSMGEVQTNVIETKAAAVNAATASAAVEQQAAANAEALKAVVQVAQVAELPGAEEVPEVILRAPNKLYTDTFN